MTLRRVLVFRGRPSSQHDPDGSARSLAQHPGWQRDLRVEVTLRPLKFDAGATRAVGQSSWMWRCSQLLDPTDPLRGERQLDARRNDDRLGSYPRHRGRVVHNERTAYDQAATAADIRLDVADLVYNARTTAGLTQIELARAAGTTQSVISASANAAQLPTVLMLDRIARALGGHLQISLAA